MTFSAEIDEEERPFGIKFFISQEDKRTINELIQKLTENLSKTPTGNEELLIRILEKLQLYMDGNTKILNALIKSFSSLSTKEDIEKILSDYNIDLKLILNNIQGSLDKEELKKYLLKITEILESSNLFLEMLEQKIHDIEEKQPDFSDLKFIIEEIINNSKERILEKLDSESKKNDEILDKLSSTSAKNDMIINKLDSVSNDNIKTLEVIVSENERVLERFNFQNENMAKIEHLIKSQNTKEDIEKLILLLKTTEKNQKKFAAEIKTLKNYVSAFYEINQAVRMLSRTKTSIKRAKTLTLSDLTKTKQRIIIENINETINQIVDAAILKTLKSGPLTTTQLGSVINNADLLRKRLRTLTKENTIKKQKKGKATLYSLV